MKLSNGYDTAIGENVSSLSSGQRQRLPIARAILKNPKILDEAASALNGQSETLIRDAISVAGRGATTIAIAHRLSAIKDAGMILYVEGGTILETGILDELVSCRGKFFELFQSQLRA
jgi:ABC-type multidrug transport system fused ATPase/permease subunit